LTELAPQGRRGRRQRLRRPWHRVVVAGAAAGVSAITVSDREHDTVPLRTTSPVPSMTSGESLVRDGHRRHVMPGTVTDRRTQRELSELRRRAAADEA
jgi:hypothetical protein